MLQCEKIAFFESQIIILVTLLGEKKVDLKINIIITLLFSIKNIIKVLISL